MKHLTALAFLFFTAVLNGNQTIPVKADEIMICGQGIFLQTDTQWLKVSALRSNPQGLLAEIDSAAEIDIGIAWTCGNCGRWNYGGDDVCRHCGAGRGQY